YLGSPFRVRRAAAPRRIWLHALLRVPSSTVKRSADQISTSSRLRLGESNPRQDDGAHTPDPTHLRAGSGTATRSPRVRHTPGCPEAGALRRPTPWFLLTTRAPANRSRRHRPGSHTDGPPSSTRNRPCCDRTKPARYCPRPRPPP